MLEKLKKNPVLIFSITLFVVAISFGLLQLNTNKKFDKQVVAVVTSTDSYYDKRNDVEKFRANCEYEVGGKTYRFSTDYSTRRYRTNDEIEIYINSDYPDRTNNHVLSKVGAFFLIFGFIFLLVSFKVKA